MKVSSPLADAEVSKHDWKIFVRVDFHHLVCFQNCALEEWNFHPLLLSLSQASLEPAETVGRGPGAEGFILRPRDWEVQVGARPCESGVNPRGGGGGPAAPPETAPTFCPK